MVYIEVEGKRYGPCTHDQAIDHLLSHGWVAQPVPDYPKDVYFYISDPTVDGPVKGRFAQIIEVEEEKYHSLNALPKPQRHDAAA